MKLTASLIIRNELGRYLEPCISHLLEFCDEIRILDDSSTDRWAETIHSGWGAAGRRVIAVQHEAEKRNDEPDFHLHAAARNRLLAFTLDGWPDYVIAVDADEFVSDGAAVRRGCMRGGDVLSLTISEVWEACDDLLCVREDGGWRSHEIGAVWRAERFRRDALLADRGHATGRVPEGVNTVPAVSTGEALLHFGWANRAERAERFERYAVGDAGRFHAAAHIASIMAEDIHVECRAREWSAALEPWREAILARANGTQNIHGNIPE